MIYDAENTFFWKKALNGTTTANSDVIKTGPGDAVCPLTLFMQAVGASGDLTMTLETAADEAFSSAVELGEYTLKKDGTVKAKIPYGDLGYLRLKYTGAAQLTSGTLTAALVMDVDLPW